MVRTMNTGFALSAYQWRGVWGERTNSTPGRGYCANIGHPEDETGLVYMRARYYEPTTGRFISEDPARDGGNWFLYADGDPVGKVDADGRRAWPVLLQVTVAAMLIGFFSSLGSYIAYGEFGWHGLSDSFKVAIFSAAVSWFVAWVVKYFWSTEGLAVRIPVSGANKVGYAKGFATVGASAFVAGVGFTLLARAGQALFEMFLMEVEGWVADQWVRRLEHGK